MPVAKLNNANPEILEAQRIAEIKSLTHLQRLERLMAILEISYMLKCAKKIKPKSE
ncbi:hypothetical protein [Flavobacterium sp.]|uniref:hypothetical protein n=1 Tax=Flavobacterium sp. TaxID=239 RepID=UPI00286A89DE|nr:hypothetical protein [Flavobacterium sp.]